MSMSSCNSRTPFLVTAIAVLLCCFAALQVAADCPRMLNPDDPPCVDAPRYYTVFTDEPDWCNYSYGDWVFERWQNISSVLTRTGWYVVPSTDSTSHPPSDFPDQYAEAGVGSSCNIIPLPW